MFERTAIIIAPVFLLIAVGWICRRVGLISGSFVGEANRFFYYIGLPALLFDKISGAHFSETFNPAQVLAATISFVLLTALAMYTAKRLKLDPAHTGSFGHAAIRGNMGYIGLGIVASAYGDAGIVAAGVYLAFMVALLNTLAIYCLVAPQHVKGTPIGWTLVRQLALNPMVLAAAAGMLWSLAEWPTGEIVGRSLGFISAMALPLALVTIGADFRLGELGNGTGLAALASFIKLVISPALCAGLLWLFGVRGLDMAVAVLLATSPTSSASYVLSVQLGGDPAVARQSVVLCTALALPAYAVVVMLLGAPGG